MVDSNEPGEIRDILEKLSQNKISLGKFWEQFRPYRWDLGGILVITLSLMTLLAWVFPSIVQGSILLTWANFLRLGLGWGSLCLIGIGLVLGIWMLKQTGTDAPDIRWGRIFALEGAAFSLIVLLTILGGHSLSRARKGLDGGLVGWGLVEAFSSLLGIFWTGVFVFLGMIAGVIIGLDLRDRVQRLYSQLNSTINETPEDLLAPSGVQKISLADPVQADVSAAEGKKRRRLPPEFRKNFQVGAKEDKPVSPLERDQRLPDLDLLLAGKSSRPNKRHINTSAGLIEKTLAEFGIPAQVIGFQVGPTVTQFAVKPGYMNGAEESNEDEKKKVRVSKITSLKRDLALALSAKQLRIQAPVPGRAYIGIEVPNEKSSLVRLRPLLESEAFYKIESPLAIALGRDVSGEPMVADLATMPHLLIAGTTGSGKSVCITSLTTCLVMNNTPKDLRLVMIDPKMVELIRFNGLPHLYGKVETDLERILGVLQWVVGEMEWRYQLLEETSSRNIDTYNRKMQSRKKAAALPRIVVMIDELADLMMMAPGQTEHSLVRLAQMARATGIHLIVATQRPSTDVVTGLIKANFPARMSFAVASSVDSRVILDTGGAESLLGNGDMLFLPPEEGSPIRAQGCIVTKQELERVIKAWSDQEVEEQETPPWESTIVEQAAIDEYDELIKDAFEIVRDSQRASTSMLQRKLRVGYPRAARMMDDLSELGFVGPSKGSGQEREVFISPDDEFEVED